MPSLAVIGHPVDHSRSPEMQTAALAALGVAGEWNYGALDAPPEDFEVVVAELALEGEYAGLNVTIPHKEAALALADSASAEASSIGAANTLRLADGQIFAANTDAAGLLAALPEDFAGERALVLGAGGAARAAAWALARGGRVAVAGPAPPADPDEDEEPPEEIVRQPLRVDVWNRTAAKAEAITGGLDATAVSDPRQSDYDLIVNTTAVGLQGEDPFALLPLTASELGPEQTVVDMVYGAAPSPLLAAAGAAGAATVDGIEVLVRQGALSLALWLDRPPLDAEVLAAMRAAAYGEDPPIT